MCLNLFIGLYKFSKYKRNKEGGSWGERGENNFYSISIFIVMFLLRFMNLRFYDEWEVCFYS